MGCEGNTLLGNLGRGCNRASGAGGEKRRCLRAPLLLPSKTEQLMSWADHVPLDRATDDEDDGNNGDGRGTAQPLDVVLCQGASRVCVCIGIGSRRPSQAMSWSFRSSTDRSACSLVRRCARARRVADASAAVVVAVEANALTVATRDSLVWRAPCAREALLTATSALARSERDHRLAGARLDRKL